MKHPTNRTYTKKWDRLINRMEQASCEQISQRGDVREGLQEGLLCTQTRAVDGQIDRDV